MNKTKKVGEEVERTHGSTDNFDVAGLEAKMLTSPSSRLPEDAKGHALVHDQPKFVLFLQLMELSEGCHISCHLVNALNDDEPPIQRLPASSIAINACP